MKPFRIETTSANGNKLNLEALYQIAPSCFTEVLDGSDKQHEGETITVEKDGRHVRMAINFKTLRQLLGDAAVEDSVEMYQFTWPGKQAARYEAATPIADTLRPVPEDSVDWDTTENLYIEGDNLRVLKLLQRGYMGKVKMIYIDPPYNTGNDFVYHDDFKTSVADEELAVGNIDEEGLRYRRNLDSNGRFHSDWCSMMYSRLLVARSLLTEDGVIFISIDDNEVQNLRKVCDEVFGENNFYGMITWSKKRKGSFLSKGIISLTEYSLVYSRNKSSCIGLFGGKANTTESQPIIKRTNKMSILSVPANIVKSKLADGLYKAGSYGDDVNPVKLLDDVNIHNGIITNPFKIEAPFVWSQKMFDDQLAKGTTFVINTMNFQLRVFRIYDDDSFKGFGSYVNGIDIKGTNEDAYEELESIFGKKKLFDYSKPTNYIREFVNAASHFDKDSIILDFFSGSATTAHAVMQLNAEDGGKRKYICVQLAEETPEDSEARKAGYKNICEIGKERIRRAGKKIKEESPLTAQHLDTGFRVFRLSDSNYEDVTKQPSEYDQRTLDLFADNIKADRTDLDLLFGAMLSWGVQLSLPMTTEEVDGCKIYTVDGNSLVACFAENITENVVKAMADKQPLRVLFRDSCFSEDKTKINIYELFKQQLDWDESEAIQNIRVV